MDAYIYRGDLYCKNCAENIKQNLHTSEPNFSSHKLDMDDSENYPQGPYPNGGGEADTPQHCGSCGIPLKNPLTEDGYNYTGKHFNVEWG